MNTTWKRYSVVDDEIQVEHIDPRMVYQDDPAPGRRLIVNADGSLSTCAVKGRRVGQSFNVQLLREAIARADPPRPWIALPQLERRTPTYLAVQLLLDTYVN